MLQNHHVEKVTGCVPHVLGPLFPMMDYYWSFRRETVKSDMQKYYTSNHPHRDTGSVVPRFPVEEQGKCSLNKCVFQWHAVNVAFVELPMDAPREYCTKWDHLGEKNEKTVEDLKWSQWRGVPRDSRHCIFFCQLWVKMSAGRLISAGEQTPQCLTSGSQSTESVREREQRPKGCLPLQIGMENFTLRGLDHALWKSVLWALLMLKSFVLK